MTDRPLTERERSAFTEVHDVIRRRYAGVLRYDQTEAITYCVFAAARDFYIRPAPEQLLDEAREAAIERMAKLIERAIPPSLARNDRERIVERDRIAREIAAEAYDAAASPNPIDGEPSE